MPIRPFIKLSREFVNAMEAGFITPFQTQHIKQKYWGMGIEDRLRIHGIIDREDYLR